MILGEMQKDRYTNSYIPKKNGSSPRLPNMATYTRVSCVLFVAVFLRVFSAHAQQLQYLNANSITAGFATGGTIFNGADTATYTNSLSSLLTVGSGYHIPTMLSGGLWIGALDPGGNGKFAASTVYRNTDWATGPCSDTYDATYDSLYNRVFKVTKSDIAYHIAHYQDNGYQMPASISSWPGTGRTLLHEQEYLAPYVDVNHNGTYDPEHGDYPNICGDEAIFFMLNDARNLHSESEGESLKVQLNILAFDVQNGVSAADSGAINSTVFMKINLVNCSATTYTKVLFSLFSDYHIGCFENDRAGCDTALNTFFGYNSSYPDSGCMNGNSSDNKAAQAITFLNQKLYTHAVFRAFTDTVNPQYAVPPGDYLRNFQSGFWYDDISEPFTVGGNGFGGQVPTHYIYPGDPLNPSDWSDMTSGTAPGQRAGIGTININTLLAGQTKNVDVAFTSSFLLASDTANEITVLKKRVSTAQNFYDGLTDCGNEYTGVNTLPTEEIEFTLYPNPASDVVHVEYSIPAQSQGRIEIADVTDRIVAQQQLGSLPAGTYNSTLDITALSKGMYICILKVGTYRFERKLVKVK